MTIEDEEQEGTLKFGLQFNTYEEAKYAETIINTDTKQKKLSMNKLIKCNIPQKPIYFGSKRQNHFKNISNCLYFTANYIPIGNTSF